MEKQMLLHVITGTLVIFGFVSAFGNLEIIVCEKDKSTYSICPHISRVLLYSDDDYTV